MSKVVHNKSWYKKIGTVDILHSLNLSYFPIEKNDGQKNEFKNACTSSNTTKFKVQNLPAQFINSQETMRIVQQIVERIELAQGN